MSVRQSGCLHLGQAINVDVYRVWVFLHCFTSHVVAFLLSLIWCSFQIVSVREKKKRVLLKQNSDFLVQHQILTHFPSLNIHREKQPSTQKWRDYLFQKIKLFLIFWVNMLESKHDKDPNIYACHLLFSLHRRKLAPFKMSFGNIFHLLAKRI